ncbi:acyl-CoA N-acyltransferase [Neohortaea acidophila]|uniref:Acyl-CoA N-acyltransferase n=1 Tax=Neohortaea acidophila TaxID=245834 RepID=A0A6A6PGH7_9PEZI|nr:acyl-CoA N-acyltransferase [Neohortaea acidophila]KAF2479082.1 acyl-CoA N-acyltransferase [Neohortaea acidophila]
MASAAQESTSTPRTSSGNDEQEVILVLANGIGVRRYQQRDVASIARHGNNKKVWANLRNRMPSPYTESDAKWWIDHNANPANHTASGPWTPETGSQGPKLPANYAITVNDEAVGSIGLEFNDPTDVSARCAEIGYWLGEEHWGKGVMSAVVPAFVAWAWSTFGILIRLDGECYEHNAYSRRLLEKAGFEVEGMRRWAIIKEGRVGNKLVLGALRPGVHDP